MAEFVTNRDDKNHGALLSGKLFTSRGQSGIANGDKLKARRGLAILGELDLQLFLLVLVLDEFKPGLVFRRALWSVRLCYQARR